jgi:hypothetical protein
LDGDLLVVNSLALEPIPGWPADGPDASDVPVVVDVTVRPLHVAAVAQALGIDLQ